GQLVNPPFGRSYINSIAIKPIGTLKAQKVIFFIFFNKILQLSVLVCNNSFQKKNIDGTICSLQKFGSTSEKIEIDPGRICYFFIFYNAHPVIEGAYPNPSFG